MNGEKVVEVHFRLWAKVYVVFASHLLLMLFWKYIDRSKLSWITKELLRLSQRYLHCTGAECDSAVWKLYIYLVHGYII